MSAAMLFYWSADWRVTVGGTLAVEPMCEIVTSLNNALAGTTMSLTRVYLRFTYCKAVRYCLF